MFSSSLPPTSPSLGPIQPPTTTPSPTTAQRILLIPEIFARILDHLEGLPAVSLAPEYPVDIRGREVLKEIRRVCRYVNEGARERLLKPYVVDLRRVGETYRAKLENAGLFIPMGMGEIRHVEAIDRPSSRPRLTNPGWLPIIFPHLHTLIFHHYPSPPRPIKFGGNVSELRRLETGRLELSAFQQVLNFPVLQSLTTTLSCDAILAIMSEDTGNDDTDYPPCPTLHHLTLTLPSNFQEGDTEEDDSEDGHEPENLSPLELLEILRILFPNLRSLRIHCPTFIVPETSWSLDEVVSEVEGWTYLEELDVRLAVEAIKRDLPGFRATWKERLGIESDGMEVDGEEDLLERLRALDSGGRNLKGVELMWEIRDERSKQVKWLWEYKPIRLPIPAPRPRAYASEEERANYICPYAPTPLADAPGWVWTGTGWEDKGGARMGLGEEIVDEERASEGGGEMDMGDEEGAVERGEKRKEAESEGAEGREWVEGDEGKVKKAKTEGDV